MFICFSCEETFEEPKKAIVSSGEYCGETVYEQRNVCPHCGEWDFGEAVECKRCGKYISEFDEDDERFYGLNHFCADCGAEILKELVDVVKAAFNHEELNFILSRIDGLELEEAEDADEYD